MSKTIKLSLLAGLMLAIGLMGFRLEPVKAEGDATAGSIIKGEGLSTLYYLGEDGKRYVFPNSKTYFSWFNDFSEVIEIPLEDLYNYPLGGNVRYKPGSLLLKIKTDPKVYAVGQNGKLRWIKNENIAKSLYGANWNLLIDDVPDSFFTNYQVDTPIESSDGYDPEEEELEIPTISYNLGFKNRLTANIQENIQERRCARLEKFITRAQERLTRWGIVADELGTDYFDECFVGDDDDDGNVNMKNRWHWHRAGKITLCHIPRGDLDATHTIVVDMNAAKAHLAQGDTLGACVSEEPSDNGDNDDESDEAAPVISDIEAVVKGTSAVVSWTTDEDADSKISFALESISSATSVTEVTDSAMNTAHSLELTGLATSTQYYFIVESKDAADNIAVALEEAFETLAE